MLHCPRILVISGEAGAVSELIRSLDAYFHVEHAGHTAEALQALDSRYFDLVLLNWDAADGRWRQELARLAKHRCAAPVVVLKAQGTPADWASAIAAGAFDLLTASCSPNELLIACEHAIATAEARRWHAPAMNELVAQVA